MAILIDKLKIWFIFIANNLFFYKMSKRKITKLNNLKFKPNSHHSSYTKKGCLILTFMRGHNKPTKIKK